MTTESDLDATANGGESRPRGMVIHDWTNDLEDFSDAVALVEASSVVDRLAGRLQCRLAQAA
jgi:hypothetical protein